MTWITVLEIFLIYQFACLLIVLLLEAFGKDTDNVSFFLCTALISVPILILGAIIKALRKSYRKRHKKFLAQRKATSHFENDFVPVLVPLKYYEYFDNSRFWKVYKRYPTKRDLKSGYDDTKDDKVRHFEYLPISYVDLQNVLNEINCFNCKHNGVHCDEDNYLCKDDKYDVMYDRYEPKHVD